MKLNKAKSVLIGQEPVKAVYLGTHLIWPSSTPAPSLPDGYESAAALETPWWYSPYMTYGIRIPYIPTTKTRIEIDFMYLPGTLIHYDDSDTPFLNYDNPVFTAVYDVTSSVSYSISGRNKNDKSHVKYHVPVYKTITSVPVEKGIRYTLIAENQLVQFIPEDSSKEAVTIHTGVDVPSVSRGKGIWLMGKYNSDSHLFHGRVYAVRIYEDGEPMMDLVPARRYLAGYNAWVAGFYDILHDSWYEAADRMTLQAIMEEPT